MAEAKKDFKCPNDCSLFLKMLRTILSYFISQQHERAHRGDKRYNCGFCQKLFMTNQQRANHERTHTGEKPYQVNYEYLWVSFSSLCSLSPPVILSEAFRNNQVPLLCK
jgi:hypothetical protein